MLIQNTLRVALVLIIYYAVVLIIGWIFSIFDTIPVLDTWRSAMPTYVQTVLNFIIYFFIPLMVIVAFIVSTKPQEENYVMGGYR